MSKGFRLGQLVATRGVAARMAEDTAFAGFVDSSLGRYITGDWGDIDGEDARANNRAAKLGDDRILAAYTDSREYWRLSAQFRRLPPFQAQPAILLMAAVSASVFC